MFNSFNQRGEPSFLTDLKLLVLCLLPSRAIMADPSKSNNTVEQSSYFTDKAKVHAGLRRFFHKVKTLSTLRKFPPKVKTLPVLTTLPPKVKSPSTLRKFPPEIRIFIFESPWTSILRCLQLCLL
jgi:hypothetical protein